ncbi:hypothetical protein BXY70_1314 [Roseovarius halotolerans]|uniref:Uncharacterized protein n=1 Tax=Roseovarius halotolerans TaxID=505353 RepID=A0A1X6Y5T4_9RHOB|nr:hypothetical protein [Roseovarius halotolerans]RKT35281.1 hypothetical protein BXY70_1314 [Roseovarius halotolerans]SLN11301.1 hypothetical protein ROH8110_00082 [Roseovarius halotolerans]
MKQDLASFLPDNAGRAAVAGIAGGIVAWVTNKQNPREGIASIIVGCITAIYLGPIVAPILEPVIGAISPGNDAVGFASFVCGMSGISISGLIMDAVKLRRGQIQHQIKTPIEESYDDDS